MPQFSPADIHDAGHRESMSLQLGTPSECNGVGLEDLPSVNLGSAFPVQDSNEGGRHCNVLPTISASGECVSRWIGIMKSKHSRRALRIQRSQIAFAFGALRGVFSIVSPNAFRPASR